MLPAFTAGRVCDTPRLMGWSGMQACRSLLMLPAFTAGRVCAAPCLMNWSGVQADRSLLMLPAFTAGRMCAAPRLMGWSGVQADGSLLMLPALTAGRVCDTPSLMGWSGVQADGSRCRGGHGGVQAPEHIRPQRAPVPCAVRGAGQRRQHSRQRGQQLAVRPCRSATRMLGGSSSWLQISCQHPAGKVGHGACILCFSGHAASLMPPMMKDLADAVLPWGCVRAACCCQAACKRPSCLSQLHSLTIHKPASLHFHAALG